MRLFVFDLFGNKLNASISLALAGNIVFIIVVVAGKGVQWTQEGYVKMTDRSEQGAPLSQGVERFAALSLCQQMATRVPVPPSLHSAVEAALVVYMQPLNFPSSIKCNSPLLFRFCYYSYK